MYRIILRLAYIKLPNVHQRALEHVRMLKSCIVETIFKRETGQVVTVIPSSL